MKTLKTIIPLAILLLIINAACSSLSVSSDYDKTTDFTKFKTYSFYGWEKNSDKILNDIDKNRIETAFANEFTKRGMTLVKENADLVVSLYIVTQEKQQTTATTTGMGGGYGGYYGYGPGYGWGGGMATTTYNTYDYTVGTLVVDVFDEKGKKLIFESTGKGTIDDNASKREKKIPYAVSQIMKSYPVKPLPSK
jgi:hypothetical protein